MTKSKSPSDTMFKGIYNAWVNMRKKVNNALIRKYWKKPDQNDNSPIASFRSRVPEKMQTRRKNKNSQNSYMKLKLVRKEIFSGRNLLINVMKREKLKIALLDLDYMEIKQMIKEKSDPNYQSDEFKEFWQHEKEMLDISLPENLANSMKDEDSISGDEISDQDSEFQLSENKIEIPPPEIKRKITQKSSFVEEPIANLLTQPSLQKPEVELPVNAPVYSPKLNLTKPTQSNEKVVVDAETISQVSIIFKKMKHLGIQFDPSRIKVSTHKPIKKEDYLNLSKAEMDEEQYYRAGIRPKSMEDEQNINLTKVKYTIFRARNGRILLLRKPIGGSYETIDSSTRCSFNRIKYESFRSMKRFKTSEDEEINSFSRINNNASFNEIREQYDDFIESESIDSDEEITDDESKSDVDDYTEGFIARLRKRKGKKRGTNDTTISFKLSNY